MEQIRTPLESGEYRDALTTVRTAKNCLWWLILLSIVVQIVGFAAVRFVGVIDDAPRLKEILATLPEQAATPEQVTATAPSEEDAVDAIWYSALLWVLPATKFIATAAGTLLILTMLVAVALALVGRIGGAGEFTSSLFWAMLLWVFLIPWQQVSGGTFACGALYNLGDLIGRTGDITWGAEGVSVLTRVIYYARFLAYPAFTAMLLLAVQARFARGWRRASSGLTRTAVPIAAGQNDNI